LLTKQKVHFPLRNGRQRLFCDTGALAERTGRKLHRSLL